MTTDRRDHALLPATGPDRRRGAMLGRRDFSVSSAGRGRSTHLQPPQPCPGSEWALRYQRRQLGGGPNRRHGIVRLRCNRVRFADHRLELIQKLRERHARMRIVVVTDVGSFATAILAPRAGADDIGRSRWRGGAGGRPVRSQAGAAAGTRDAARGRTHVLGADPAHRRAGRPRRERAGATARHASSVAAAHVEQAGAAPAPAVAGMSRVRVRRPACPRADA